MHIELKNLKVVKALSEETVCFTAKLYIEGVACGMVSNRGTGGAHEYTDRTAAARLNAYASELPNTPVASHYADILPDGLPQSADSLIDDAVEAMTARKELTARLKKRVLYTTTAGTLMQTNTMAAEMLTKAVAFYVETKPFDSVSVLNALPFEDALTIYLKH
jgi:hypothetical protein